MDRLTREPAAQARGRQGFSTAERERVVNPRDITVVIPTFGRHEVLVETVERELELQPPPAEVIVVDQTPRHPPGVERRLRFWQGASRIKWLFLAKPSQPAAMNAGLLAAATDHVLFQDDDLIPCPNLIQAYVDALNDMQKLAPDCSCVVGQVLQPGREEIDYRDWKPAWCAYPSFPFNSSQRRFIDEAAAGNICVNRRRAIVIGGFDENFVGAAHKCDTEFARRLIHNDGCVLYEPRASIRHLLHPTGGVRTYGDYLRTWRPHYPVGGYYLAFRCGFPAAFKTTAWLLLRCITTRHHLRRPWYIPLTMISNLLAVGWALWLWGKGPALIADEAIRSTLGDEIAEDLRGLPTRSVAVRH